MAIHPKQLFIQPGRFSSTQSCTRAAVAQYRTKPVRETSLQYCWAAIGGKECLGFEIHSCADPSGVDRPDTSTAKARSFRGRAVPTLFAARWIVTLTDRLGVSDEVRKLPIPTGDIAPAVAQ